jgi:hypothetical protein
MDPEQVKQSAAPVSRGPGIPRTTPLIPQAVARKPPADSPESVQLPVGKS